MKPFNMDAYQYLKRNNPHSGGTDSMLIRSLYPAYPTKLSIKDVKKERLHFSNKWVGVNEKFPFEVEITVPWYQFSRSNFVKIPKSSSITIAGGDYGIPRNWTSKIGLETLNILQSVLDSRKTLRKKKLPFLFAGLGFSARPLLGTIGRDYPVFGNLPLKVFFLFSKKSDAEKYVKQLKSTRAFKAFSMEAKIRNFSEPKPGKQSAYSKMDLYNNYMFWDRRALLTESKSKKLLPPLFTPLAEWSSLPSEKPGTKMPKKKSTSKTSKKKLSVAKAKSEAIKYNKSRSKKKWPNLLKKFGMTQARQIVKVAKLLSGKTFKQRSKSKSKTKHKKIEFTQKDGKFFKKVGKGKKTKITKQQFKKHIKEAGVPQMTAFEFPTITIFFSSEAKGSRKTLKPVPQHMKAVSGKRTPPFAIPKGKKFPIGTLAYAKKAIDYLTWDAQPKVRNYNAYHVMTAVKKRYPQYDWAGYWNKLRKTVKNEKQLKSWAQYTKGKA